MAFSGLRLNRGALIRLLADAVLLQVALIAALVVRFYILVHFEGLKPGTDPVELLNRYQHWYLLTTVPLTALCLTVFYLTGFYTRGETYQSRYKVLVVAQAVSFSFLAYISVVLFFGIYGGRLSFAKGAMLLAWGFSIVLLAGMRVWNQIWQRTAPWGVDGPRKSAVGEQRVLVIGGAGYIGSALIPKLLDSGYTVRVLDMMIFGESPLDGVRNHPRLELVKGDFRQVDVVVQAMQDVATVVHLGAIVGDPACNLDEALTIDINLSATKMIADLAKQHRVSRFVFASTCSVYGASPNTLDERSVVRPLGIYGHTKYASEKVLLQMADARFQPVILRFATIYGLSGRTRFDLVVNLLTAKARFDGEITVHDGDQWRPFVHVDDAAAAVQAVIQAPLATVGNEIFNVGNSDQNFTIRQIGELIHQQVPESRLVFSETAQDRRDYRVDFSKIRNLLNYRPAWTVPEGIQQVLEAIQSGRVTDYRAPQYSNVAFLRREGTTGLSRDRWARELIEDLSNQN